jgi:four helix bundle protein
VARTLHARAAPGGAGRRPPRGHGACSAAAPVDAHEAPLSPERLDCYRVSLEFNAVAARLVPRGHREVRDQLTRASLSISANLAEGCGRSAAADKAHFYAIARGSAMECAAIVDVMRSLGLAPVAACKEARWLLVRIVQMLTKLEAATAGR